MSAGAGWQLPRRHDRSELAARRDGYQGMDTMLSPRAASPRVNAMDGTPPNNDAPRHPRGYAPKGRVPVSTHERPGTSSGRIVWASWANVQDYPGLKKRSQPRKHDISAIDRDARIIILWHIS